MKSQHRLAKAVVFVATPTQNGSLVHQYLTSYMQSFTDCIRKDIVLAPEFAVSFSLVQYARNWLVHQFLSDLKFTHMLWIDSDIGWQATAVADLVLSGKDVIGGSYTTKSPTRPIYPFVACGPVEDGIQEVTCLPGGFLLMSRKAVQALADASPTMVMEHGGQDHEVQHVCDLELVTQDENGKTTRRLVGEDYVMQIRLRALGFKLYLKTNIDFVHVGLKEYLGNVDKAYEAEKAAGLNTMWHESSWNKAPLMATDERTDPVLLVPENEVPTPHTLDLKQIVADAHAGA